MVSSREVPSPYLEVPHSWGLSSIGRNGMQFLKPPQETILRSGCSEVAHLVCRSTYGEPLGMGDFSVFYALPPTVQRKIIDQPSIFYSHIDVLERTCAGTTEHLVLGVLGPSRECVLIGRFNTNQWFDHVAIDKAAIDAAKARISSWKRPHWSMFLAYGACALLSIILLASAYTHEALLVVHQHLEQSLSVDIRDTAGALIIGGLLLAVFSYSRFLRPTFLKYNEHVRRRRKTVQAFEEFRHMAA